MRRLLTLLSWAPVGVVISDKAFTLHRDGAGALSPSIPANSVVLVSRLHPARSLVRGDAVLVDDLDGRGRLIRRVIGLPGDCVRLREPVKGESATKIVPHGFVWLQADARAPMQKPSKDVKDSDDFGAVPIAMVTGRVMRVLNNGESVRRKPSDRVLQNAGRYT